MHKWKEKMTKIIVKVNSGDNRAERRFSVRKRVRNSSKLTNINIINLEEKRKAKLMKELIIN